MLLEAALWFGLAWVAWAQVVAVRKEGVEIG